MEIFRNIVFTCIVISLMSSCMFIHIDDSIDLGDGFYYVQDGKNSSIILSNSNFPKGSGSEVIPPEILQYAYDEKIIMAEIRNEKMEMEYWVVDKKMNDKPVIMNNMIEFQNYLFSNKITLELTPARARR